MHPDRTAAEAAGVSGFVLSPGITPELVSACAIELPLVLGLAYVFYRNRGLEFAILLNALAYGAIKVVTDYFDVYDMLVTAGCLGAAIVMVGSLRRPSNPPRGRVRFGGFAVALYGILVGTVKIVTDPLDPFDTFLSALAILAGALVVRWLLYPRFSGASRGTAS